MIAHFKKTNATTVIEIGLGVFAAIMVLRLLSVMFGRSSSVFGAEDPAEDLENFGGRGRARRAGRQAKRETRKETRAHNEDVRTKKAIARGKAKGSSNKLPDYEEEQPEEEEEMQEEMEMLEMAEYFDSLDAEDIENMDAEEQAEYEQYLEMLDEAA